jgi:threonine aldolase
MKEAAIRDYVSRIDFKSDDWKLSKIKEDMRKFLGEEPGIDVIYKKDVMINEVTGKAQEIKDIDKVQIIFFDTDERFKKIEFTVNEIL